MMILLASAMGAASPGLIVLAAAVVFAAVFDGFVSVGDACQGLARERERGRR